MQRWQRISVWVTIGLIIWIISYSLGVAIVTSEGIKLNTRVRPAILFRGSGFAAMAYLAVWFWNKLRTDADPVKRRKKRLAFL